MELSFDELREKIPFDLIPQLMLSWVSELPEYRLHFVTGSVDMS